MSNQLRLEVDHSVTTIRGSMHREVYNELKKALSYEVEQAHWIIKHQVETKGREWMKNWDGRKTVVCYDKARCKCHNRKAGTHFPTGLLGMAMKFFDQYGIPYDLTDIRKIGTGHLELSMSDDFEERDYQTKIIADACHRQRGIIKIATGGGKTGVACGIIANLGVVPFVFYVTSQDLLHQAKSEIEKFVRYMGYPVRVGAVGAGHKDIQDITVMTVQTAVRALGGVWVKYDEEDRVKDETDIDDIRQDIVDLIRSSRGMICDETQHWASETCQIIADSSEMAQYRYGFSATPWRDMGDDLLIDACFGKVIADVNASFLIQRGYLIQPEILFVPVQNMTRSPYKSYQKIYKNCLVNNSQRNEWIANLAKGFEETGRLTLILVIHVAHGNMLETMIPGSTFLHGSISQKKRKNHIQKMRERADDAKVTIATSIFDEGIDVKPLDTLILAGGGKSQTRALQRIGRVLRPCEGKKSATIVDMYDHVKYLKEHAAKRESIYKTEEKFAIKHVSMV